MQDSAVQDPVSPASVRPRFSLAAIVFSLVTAAAVWDFLVRPAVVPTLGMGLFLLFLGGLALANREVRERTPQRWVFLAMLVAGAVQSAFDFSFSSFVSMTMLVALIAWEGAEAPRDRWLRVCECGLGFWRPLGLLHVLARSRKPAGFKRPSLRTFLAVGTALWLVLFFAFLLLAGNAVFRKLLGDLPEWIARIDWLPGFGQVFGWGFAAYVAMFVAFPPGATFVSRLLSGSWPRIPVPDMDLRVRQCLWSLAGLNLLFLANNAVDLVYLWGSHRLPEGVTFSQYLHSGVYVLIFTTVLSGLLMALLAQNPGEVTRHRGIRLLNWLWMGQNVFLALGVFRRLALYVGAYGYSPKRLYVAMFVCLVLGGYALLATAFQKGRDIRWLVQTNLTLVFFYFFFLQFFSGEFVAARLNLGLLREERISLRGQVDLFGYRENASVREVRELERPQVYVMASVATDPSFPAALRAEAGKILDSDKALRRNYAERFETWQGIRLIDCLYYAPYQRYLSSRSAPTEAVPVR
jgi:hypothetical protein